MTKLTLPPALHLVPPGVPPPWMPLDGLAQLWTTFGAEVSPHFSDAAYATSAAFAALATEQAALAWTRNTPNDTWDGTWDRATCVARLPETRSIGLLGEAAAQWTAVIAHLDDLDYTCGKEGQRHAAICLLIDEALTQQLRLGQIAEHLLFERQRRYRTNTSVPQATTDDEQVVFFPLEDETSSNTETEISPKEEVHPA